MANKRLSMSKEKEIIRLKSMGLRERAIARALNCSRHTVKKYISKQGCLPPPPVVTPSWISNLNWNELYNENLQKGVPLLVLWEEGVETNKIPVQYPAFWKQFSKRYPHVGDATMVRHFRPGERVEIDYADGIEILEASTGEIIKTQLFVGTLCCSRYVFAEFTFTQSSQDFLSSHVRMFNFFGGVPAIVTPDNLKSAVTKAHKYDPERNPAYARLAAHYDIAIIPARVRTPKDKAIVERTIQIFQRWFYYRVRKRTFTSIVELNKCLQEHLVVFHSKKHRIFQKTRAEMFEEERSELASLPHAAYEVATHKQATLSLDCHLQFDKNFYSAPWNLRGKKLDVWCTDKTVEIWNGGERVAFHSRSYTKGFFRTNDKHYPPHHRAYLEIGPSNLRVKAKLVGDKTYQVIDSLFQGKYPLKYLRRAQGIIALAKKYSPDQLEQACERALVFEKYYVPFIEALIKNAPTIIDEKKVVRSTNPFLRGKELYQ